MRLGGFLVDWLLDEEGLRWGVAAGGPTAVVGGVRLPTAGEVKTVGHGNAILALPVPFPLEAVPFVDAFPVDFEGYAVSSPLL